MMEDREPEAEKGGPSAAEEALGSSLTMEKVAAAKQYIENHYRAQMKNIQDRKERQATKDLLFINFSSFSSVMSIDSILCSD